jgi:predicted glycosyltransferase
MTLRILFTSHDGFGLGHVRRNARLAAAVRRRTPDVELTLVTGISSAHRWLDDAGFRVERVPSLAKGATGRYENAHLPLDQTLAVRARRFEQLVIERQPHLVVIDRHPFGIGGELRAGIGRAKQQGAAIVLGLRDVLDEPDAVRRELAGEGWQGASAAIDQVLVYGAPQICDHEREYSLPVKPTYCGAVVDAPAARPVESTLVVCAGGGADGREVAQLGVRLADHPAFERTVVVLGPAARDEAPPAVESERLRIVRSVSDCGALFASASGSLQMAGYNSTYEALAAGLRPVVVPRREPRREQAIRATRLGALGLADVVDTGASLPEVGWLFDRPRRLDRGALASADVRLDGAEVAADHLCNLVGATSRGAA